MPYPGHIPKFANFQQYLVGRWSNQSFGTDSSGDSVGGKDNPLSYNVMPLPQISEQPDQADYPGYIMINFRYYETIEFNDQGAIASPALAPNRGGRFNQDARALFYEQQVKFGEGPAKDKIVHIENGSWLYLQSEEQQIGPYNQAGTVRGKIEPQPADLTTAKQIAVPHGNSVLAFGRFDENPQDGAPNIEDANPPYPKPGFLSVEPYATKRTDDDNFQNPNPDFAQNPNLPLQMAVNIIDPDAFLHWSVTTDPLGDNREGVVTNIPFEQQLAEVTEYDAEYWLLSDDGGDNFDYLAYTQTMCMVMIIRGQKYEFPHVTSNVVVHNS